MGIYFRWSRKLDRFLRDHYLEYNDRQISSLILEKFGLTVGFDRVKKRRTTLGLDNLTLDTRYRSVVKASKIRSMKVDCVTERFVFTEFDLHCNVYYVVTWLKFPHYICVANTLTYAKDLLKKKILHYNQGGRATTHITMSKCRAIRGEYCRGVPCTVLSKQYHISYNEIRHIVRNTRWTDKTYFPPQARVGRHTRITAEIYSEVKGLAQWASDPRAEVGYQVIRLRYRDGVRGEALIKRIWSANHDDPI